MRAKMTFLLIFIGLIISPYEVLLLLLITQLTNI